MKYKTFIFAALLLMTGFSGFGITRSASAVMCPPGSERNKTGTAPVDVPDINSVAQCSLPKEEAKGGLMNNVTKVINTILGILGIVAVVVIIIGGIGFITSQGDSGKVIKEKNTILYGVIGMVVALLAYAIVNFVLNGIFGSNSSTSGSVRKASLIATDDIGTIEITEA